ncbi:hypothetical protein [Pseudoponticoccus marisrubri]|uniref:Uncharacterized protein n=1 Tax=Pseudoponticoccus marisrubri TaxID=1685382 RepID=A0A0W7WQJ7_9RHOB|nr:hypothetical protein [Pseudoponticoccus marisrubri]KUF12760.1 hypothetical protein AVJ23_03355 [Pseudoponticoccus marisrubri]
MAGAARRDGMLTAGLVSAALSALAALLGGLLLVALSGGGPEFWLLLLVLGAVVPVPWLVLRVLSAVREAETLPGLPAPAAWQGWGVLLPGLAVWLAQGWAALWIASGGPAGPGPRGLDPAGAALAGAVLLLPVPALVALGNFCLRGRPVPPGGGWDETAR